MPKMKSYRMLRDLLDTGDLVLFSGQGPQSDKIKRITKSFWSHVGMIDRISEPKRVLLWESTTLDNIVDILSL